MSGSALVPSKVLMSAAVILILFVNAHASGFIGPHYGIFPACVPRPSERHLSDLSRAFNVLKGPARKLHDLPLLRWFTGLSSGLAQRIIEEYTPWRTHGGGYGIGTG